MKYAVDMATDGINTQEHMVYFILFVLANEFNKHANWVAVAIAISSLKLLKCKFISKFASCPAPPPEQLLATSMVRGILNEYSSPPHTHVILLLHHHHHHHHLLPPSSTTFCIRPSGLFPSELFRYYGSYIELAGLLG
jgi:hypothetical protein